MSSRTVIWSLTLHVAVLAAVVVGLPWRIERPRVPVMAAAPIQGVIIDQAAIEREKEKREEAARAEQQRQRREAAEQQRQQQAERQRREAAEQQRVAAETRAREDAQRKEEERLAAERAEQRRREEQAQAEREAQAKREREEAERRAQQAEQRRRQQAEAELQAQLAAEAEANAARAAGLLDQYLLMIENKIKQKWQRPLSARPGIDCVVRVVQTLTGDVVSATVATCNGDEAVRRSIERAVLDASPLPRPPHPALFDRNLNVNFRPEE